MFREVLIGGSQGLIKIQKSFSELKGKIKNKFHLLCYFFNNQISWMKLHNYSKNI